MPNEKQDLTEFIEIEKSQPVDGKLIILSFMAGMNLQKTLTEAVGIAEEPA